MNQEEVKKEMQRILSEHRVGTLTTMKANNQPFARYMIFRPEEFKLFTVSSKKTEKVQDIINNNKVHILLGFEGASGYGKPYIDMTATATIHDEEELKKRLWHDNFKKYLEGPADPNYIVIRCEPKTIRLINHPDCDGPQTITF